MGWITANHERISIRKEIEWLERYLEWSREYANYSRRCHTAALQSDMLLLAALIVAGAFQLPWYGWAAAIVAAAISGFMMRGKADKALYDQSEKKPTTMFEGNFFDAET